MKPLLVIVPLLLLSGLSAAQAQPLPAQNIEASKIPDAGPLVTGGNGATAGPNSRNQAVSPMPGMPDEQLDEAPAGGRASPLTLPLPAPSVRKR
ncbi:MAG: hypothetical protein U1E23_06795 [Reyranellaceae bacterium]